MSAGALDRHAPFILSYASTAINNARVDGKAHEGGRPSTIMIARDTKASWTLSEPGLRDATPASVLGGRSATHIEKNAKARQSAKIKQLSDALLAFGLLTLDRQARALGWLAARLGRS